MTWPELVGGIRIDLPRHQYRTCLNFDAVGQHELDVHTMFQGRTNALKGIHDSYGVFRPAVLDRQLFRFRIAKLALAGLYLYRVNLSQTEGVDIPVSLKELTVRRSVWNSTVSEPKTRRSRSPIPVVKQLAEALEAHRLRAGILAQPGLPIFQAGNGKPLNLDNLVRRVIQPTIEKCGVCKLSKEEHRPEGHLFEHEGALPTWHGCHAFRRGLATNLHALGVDDKTIQAIPRHSNIGITQNIYIKSVSESQVSAMDSLSEKLGTCNDLATNGMGTIQ